MGDFAEHARHTRKMPCTKGSQPLFCARGKSDKSSDEKMVGCNCPDCGVHKRYKLTDDYYARNQLFLPVYEILPGVFALDRNRIMRLPVILISPVVRKSVIQVDQKKTNGLFYRYRLK